MFEKEVTLLKKYLKEEYAGYEDKKEIIEDLQLNDIQDFYLDVTAQLNRLEDLHLRLVDKENKSNPVIQVKNLNNKLYVTESVTDELPKGTEIIKLGNYTIKEIIAKEALLLFDSDPERYMWTNVLRKYPLITTSDGSTFNILKEMDRADFNEKKHQITYRKDYCYLYFPDFAETDVINHLIKDHHDLLNSSQKFILDVRDNKGGSDFAYLPLLEYIFPAKFRIYYDSTDYYFNYTKNYCDSTIPVLEDMMGKMPEGDTKESFKEYTQRLKDNYGKGMTNIGSDEAYKIIDGHAEDIEVVLIANERCGSSGDNFVKSFSDSPFVTTVGRATLGMNDYANCGYLPLNDQFDLMCAYSRDGNIDIGKGMAMKGIEPDIHIPWTTDEIFEDVLLKKAEELLNVN